MSRRRVTVSGVDLLRLAGTLGRTLQPSTRLEGSSVVVPSGAPITSIPADVLEAFGVHTGGTISRSQAMSIPAMRRARQIICGTLGTLPLQAQRVTDRQLVPVDTGSTATLLAQLDPRTTPQWTLTWTFDDLLHRGISWWRVTARDSYGWPLAVERLAPGRVTVVPDGVAYLDGRPVEDRDLIRFDGPDSGVLVDGAFTLRTCLLLEAAVRRNSTGMPPLDYFQPAEGAPDLTEAQVAALLSEWATTRAEYGTGYMNRSLEHNLVGFNPRDSQLVEARQQQAVEVARMVNLDAQELNAPAGTGMTYANTEAKRRDLIDVSLGLYMTAVAQRLSMSDVTPRGQKVRLDTTGFIRGTTADAIKAAVEATGGPVMTSQESRQGLLGLPAEPSLGQLAKPTAPAPQEAPA